LEDNEGQATENAWCKNPYTLYLRKKNLTSLTKVFLANGMVDIGKEKSRSFNNRLSCLLDSPAVAC